MYFDLKQSFVDDVGVLPIDGNMNKTKQRKVKQTFEQTEYK